MVDLIPQYFEKSAGLCVELSHVGDFFKYIAELFVEEKNLFLEQLILTGCGHLAHSCQENVYVTRRARFNEISEH